MGRGPVFIVGLERSGMTLLCALLASHPNIVITRRTNFWDWFFNRYGDLHRPRNLERCLAAMMHCRRFQVLNPNLGRLREEFWQGEPSYTRLFELFQEQYARRLGKLRWGDKSLNTERYTDVILSAYPRAKMIHMIRDPRDRFEPSSMCWPKQFGKVGAATAKWLSSVGLARRNVHRFPDRYQIVRYEMLVSHPEETLQGVCDFLGEEYAPIMLTMDGAPDLQQEFVTAAKKEEGECPVSTDFIGCFRGMISNREIAFIQACAKWEMLACEYLLEPIHFSPGERLLYYFLDWPANWLRKVVRQKRDAARDCIPALFGRTPRLEAVIHKAT